jgi:hypothetical protein
MDTSNNKETTMNKKLTLSAVILSTTLLSTAALADGRDHDGWRDYRHHGSHGWQSAPAHVVYAPPRPVYARPPVAYYQPAYYQPTYYPQQAYVPEPTYYAPARVHYRGDRVAGQVVGAVAGGVIGNAIGHGGIAPTAIGAVLGGLIGGDLAD